MKLIAIVMLGALAVSGCGRGNKLNIGPVGPLDSNMDEVKEMNSGGLVRMAQSLEQSGDYGSAAQFYRDALNRDPNILEAHLGMAGLYERAGDMGRAAAYYQNVLVLDPGHLPAVLGAARNLINQQRALDARAVIEGYLAENQPTAALLNQLGVAMDLSVNHAGAGTAYREGLAMVAPGDNWHVILLNNLALSLSLGEHFSEAILLLNPHIGDMRLGTQGISKAQSSFRQNLALVYALSGKPESAYEVARSALGEDLATHNRSFYTAIPNLNDYERARAVFLGVLPDDAG